MESIFLIFLVPDYIQRQFTTFISGIHIELSLNISREQEIL